ncbi:MAG TPA: hypothetical protein VFT45_00615 [Longimicrobium sp.]|nr:hypothetical protein [Longimicrobium sp.]
MDADKALGLRIEEGVWGAVAVFRCPACAGEIRHPVPMGGRDVTCACGAHIHFGRPPG